MTGNGLPRCTATDRWVMAGHEQDIPCDAQPVYIVDSKYNRCEHHKNDVPRSTHRQLGALVGSPCHS